MYPFIKKFDFDSMTFINLLTKNGEPNIDGLVTTPIIITSAVLMAISVMLPCLIWFIRNFMRIIMKKNYTWLNRSLKWILLLSLLIFIVSIILMVLAIQGII